MSDKLGLKRWTNKVLSAVLIVGLSMTMSSLSAAHNDKFNNGKGASGAQTPFARIAKIPVVKNDDGTINHTATYAKAKVIALDIARHIAHVDDAADDGTDFPANWIVGGLEGGETADDATIQSAIINIPSPNPIDPSNPALGVKKANVMDLCNSYYAKMALGVAPIIGDKKVVNGYSHAPALPCQLATWNDDEHIYIDMLDPNSIFTLFFTDVLISEDMQDPDFADAIRALPVDVKSEIKQLVYNALDEAGHGYKSTDQQIGPKYKNLEQIFEVVDNSPYGSPYKHVAYTKSTDGAFGTGETKTVAQAIINALSIHGEPGAGTHEEPLESILSPGSSWRSARHTPLGLPGSPEKNWVIEACSPKYAKMAMGTGMHHATALPCEIAVQRVDRDGDGITESLVISYLDPGFMLNALFADITDEEKEGMAAIPGYILSDLEKVVTHALSDFELNDGVLFDYVMSPNQ